MTSVKPLIYIIYKIIYITLISLSSLLISLCFYIFLVYIISFTLYHCVSFYSLSLCVCLPLCFHFTLFDRYRTKGRSRDPPEAYEGSRTRTLWLQSASFVLMIHEKAQRCEGSGITIGIGFCATDKLQVVCDWTGNHLLPCLSSEWVIVFVNLARGKWHNQVRNSIVSKSITSRQNVVVKKSFAIWKLSMSRRRKFLFALRWWFSGMWHLVAGLHPQSTCHFAWKRLAQVSQILRPSYRSQVIAAAT
jgi:hypothetical protein